jgi:hypothetical protein
MSEVEEHAGVSRLERNVFIVLFELMGFIISVMMYIFSNSLNTLKPGFVSSVAVSGMLVFLIGVSIVMGIHVVYLTFLTLILKRDEEIKELSTRMYKLNTWIVPKKKVVLKTFSNRTMQPTQITQSQDQTVKILASSMIKYICRKLIQNELPTDFNLELVFKTLKDPSYWGSIDFNPNKTKDPDGLMDDRKEFVDASERMADEMIEESFQHDSDKIAEVGSRSVEVGPRDLIVKFIENQKNKYLNKPVVNNILDMGATMLSLLTVLEEFVKQYESKDDQLEAFIYFFDETLSIDNEMGFKESNITLNPVEQKALGELDELLGKSEPKAAIIWKPYAQSDPERKIYKYNKVLDDYIKSFVVEGYYFFMGSVAGVPILLDILCVDKLQKFYDARFDLSGLNNLKLNALTFLLVALAERWDRRTQSENKNELYAKLTQQQADLSDKQIKNFLTSLRDDIKQTSKDYNIIPKKIDLTFWFAFGLGALLAIVICLLIWYE